ncbi:hypothetical protein DIPPA_11963 [Diplonema papillatum]|nr:hypothetical protein DIPPA_11963 [Diplonema papillatum]
MIRLRGVLLCALVSGGVGCLSGYSGHTYLNAEGSVQIACFKYYATTPLVWDGALQACRRENGTLAVVTDEVANFVGNMIVPATGAPWVGGLWDQTEGRWRWVDRTTSLAQNGSVSGYTAWRMHRPSGKSGCTQLSPQVRPKYTQIQDRECSALAFYVCQAPPLPPAMLSLTDDVPRSMQTLEYVAISVQIRDAEGNRALGMDRSQMSVHVVKNGTDSTSSGIRWIRSVPVANTFADSRATAYLRCVAEGVYEARFSIVLQGDYASDAPAYKPNVTLTCVQNTLVEVWPATASTTSTASEVCVDEAATAAEAAKMQAPAEPGTGRTIYTYCRTSVSNIYWNTPPSGVVGPPDWYDSEQEAWLVEGCADFKNDSTTWSPEVGGLSELTVVFNEPVVLREVRVLVSAGTGFVREVSVVSMTEEGRVIQEDRDALRGVSADVLYPPDEESEDNQVLANACAENLTSVTMVPPLLVLPVEPCAFFEDTALSSTTACSVVYETDRLSPARWDTCAAAVFEWSTTTPYLISYASLVGDRCLGYTGQCHERVGRAGAVTGRFYCAATCEVLQGAQLVESRGCTVVSSRGASHPDVCADIAAELYADSSSFDPAEAACSVFQGSCALLREREGWVSQRLACGSDTRPTKTSKELPEVLWSGEGPNDCPGVVLAKPQQVFQADRISLVRKVVLKVFHGSANPMVFPHLGQIDAVSLRGIRQNLKAVATGTVYPQPLDIAVEGAGLSLASDQYALVALSSSSSDEQKTVACGTLALPQQPFSHLTPSPPALTVRVAATVGDPTRKTWYVLCFSSRGIPPFRPLLSFPVTPPPIRIQWENNDPPPSTAVAGVAVAFAVQQLDVQNAVSPLENSTTLTITAKDPLSGDPVEFDMPEGARPPFTGGTASFSLVFPRPGAVQLAVRASWSYPGATPDATGAVAELAVEVGPAAVVSFVSFVGTVTTGEAVVVTVRVADAFGNLVASDSDSEGYAESPRLLTAGGVAARAVAGVMNFSLVFSTVGDGIVQVTAKLAPSGTTLVITAPISVVPRAGTDLVSPGYVRVVATLDLPLAAFSIAEYTAAVSSVTNAATDHIFVTSASSDAALRTVVSSEIVVPSGRSLYQYQVAVSQLWSAARNNVSSAIMTGFGLLSAVVSPVEEDVSLVDPVVTVDAPWQPNMAMSEAGGKVTASRRLILRARVLHAMPYRVSWACDEVDISFLRQRGLVLTEEGGETLVFASNALCPGINYHFTATAADEATTRRAPCSALLQRQRHQPTSTCTLLRNETASFGWSSCTALALDSGADYATLSSGRCQLFEGACSAVPDVLGSAMRLCGRAVLQSHATLTVQVNTPPRQNVAIPALTMSPGGGAALETVFEINACAAQWQDEDQPLTYRFSYTPVGGSISGDGRAVYETYSVSLKTTATPSADGSSCSVTDSTTAEDAAACVDFAVSSGAGFYEYNEESAECLVLDGTCRPASAQFGDECAQGQQKGVQAGRIEGETVVIRDSESCSASTILPEGDLEVHVCVFDSWRASNCSTPMLVTIDAVDPAELEELVDAIVASSTEETVTTQTTIASAHLLAQSINGLATNDSNRRLLKKKVLTGLTSRVVDPSLVGEACSATVALTAGTDNDFDEEMRESLADYLGGLLANAASSGIEIDEEVGHAALESFSAVLLGERQPETTPESNTTTGGAFLARQAGLLESARDRLRLSSEEPRDASSSAERIRRAAKIDSALSGSLVALKTGLLAGAVAGEVAKTVSSTAISLSVQRTAGVPRSTITANAASIDLPAELAGEVLAAPEHETDTLFAETPSDLKTAIAGGSLPLSAVVSFSLFSSASQQLLPVQNLTRPLRITTESLTAVVSNETTVKCMWWDTAQLTWSSLGCRLVFDGVLFKCGTRRNGAPMWCTRSAGPLVSSILGDKTGVEGGGSKLVFRGRRGKVLQDNTVGGDWQRKMVCECDHATDFTVGDARDLKPEPNFPNLDLGNLSRVSSDVLVIVLAFASTALLTVAMTVIHDCIRMSRTLSSTRIVHTLPTGKQASELDNVEPLPDGVQPCKLPWLVDLEIESRTRLSTLFKLWARICLQSHVWLRTLIKQFTATSNFETHQKVLVAWSLASAALFVNSIWYQQPSADGDESPSLIQVISNNGYAALSTAAVLVPSAVILSHFFLYTPPLAARESAAPASQSDGGQHTRPAAVPRPAPTSFRGGRRTSSGGENQAEGADDGEQAYSDDGNGGEEDDVRLQDLREFGEVRKASRNPLARDAVVEQSAAGKIMLRRSEGNTQSELLFEEVTERLKQRLGLGGKGAGTGGEADRWSVLGRMQAEEKEQLLRDEVTGGRLHCAITLAVLIARGEDLRRDATIELEARDMQHAFSRVECVFTALEYQKRLSLQQGTATAHDATAIVLRSNIAHRIPVVDYHTLFAEALVAESKRSRWLPAHRCLYACRNALPTHDGGSRPQLRLAATLFQVSLLGDNPDLFTVIHSVDASCLTVRETVERMLSDNRIGRLYYLRAPSSEFRRLHAASAEVLPQDIEVVYGLTNAIDPVFLGGVPYVSDVELAAVVKHRVFRWKEGVEEVAKACAGSGSLVRAAHVFRHATLSVECGARPAEGRKAASSPFGSPDGEGEWRWMEEIYEDSNADRQSLWGSDGAADASRAAAVKRAIDDDVRDERAGCTARDGGNGSQLEPTAEAAVRMFRFKNVDFLTARLLRQEPEFSLAAEGDPLGETRQARGIEYGRLMARHYALLAGLSAAEFCERFASEQAKETEKVLPHVFSNGCPHTAIAKHANVLFASSPLNRKGFYSSPLNSLTRRGKSSLGCCRGTGSMMNPFIGLDTAVAFASEGTTIVLLPGVYPPTLIQRARSRPEAPVIIVAHDRYAGLLPVEPPVEAFKIPFSVPAGCEPFDCVALADQEARLQAIDDRRASPVRIVDDLSASASALHGQRTMHHTLDTEACREEDAPGTPDDDAGGHRPAASSTQRDDVRDNYDEHGTGRPGGTHSEGSSAPEFEVDVASEAAPQEEPQRALETSPADKATQQEEEPHVFQTTVQPSPVSGQALDNSKADEAGVVSTAKEESQHEFQASTPSAQAAPGAQQDFAGIEVAGADIPSAPNQQEETLHASGNSTASIAQPSPDFAAVDLDNEEEVEPKGVQAPGRQVQIGLPAPLEKDQTRTNESRKGSVPFLRERASVVSRQVSWAEGSDECSPEKACKVRFSGLTSDEAANCTLLKLDQCWAVAIVGLHFVNGSIAVDSRKSELVSVRDCCITDVNHAILRSAVDKRLSLSQDNYSRLRPSTLALTLIRWHHIEDYPLWWVAWGYLLCAGYLAVCLVLIVLQTVSFGAEETKGWLQVTGVSLATDVFITRPILSLVKVAWKLIRSGTAVLFGLVGTIEMLRNDT